MPGRRSRWVGTHVPQVGRPRQPLGGLAARTELLCQVGALEKNAEGRRTFTGTLAVGRDVAQPAQLVDTLGRD